MTPSPGRGAGEPRAPWSSVGGRSALRRTAEAPPASEAVRVASLHEARHAIRRLEFRNADLERTVRGALERLGRRASEVAALEARIADLELLARAAAASAGDGGPTADGTEDPLRARDAEIAALRAENDALRRGLLCNL